MKKIGICIMLLIMMACAKQMVSENGSFKKSLKPDYYVKACYQYTSAAQETMMVVGGWALLGIPGAALSLGVSNSMSDVLCNQDIDEAISECIKRAYLFSKRYHCSQIDAKHPLDIYVDPWYYHEKDRIVGLSVRLSENIPNKDVFLFENYREVRLDAEKNTIVPHRENISEDEATLERRKYIVRLQSGTGSK